ncbi:MAG: hypothetical protein M5U34_20595 [Chloroflexi bacterium]|nr:hypothetical protein [Chloroflexota bacterium]
MKNGNRVQIDDEVFDYVVVGSGFGGSVSAMRLSEKRIPRSGFRTGQTVSKPKIFLNRTGMYLNICGCLAARCFGIMGINFFDDIWILNGSGVGGGSLVYASTHIKPPKAFFEAPEWKGLADWEAELTPFLRDSRPHVGHGRKPQILAGRSPFV